MADLDGIFIQYAKEGDRGKKAKKKWKVRFSFKDADVETLFLDDEELFSQYFLSEILSRVL